MMSKRRKVVNSAKARPHKATTTLPNIKKNPETLLDLCARQVAATIPFQRIEERYNRIPEPVQERVVFWSFPRNEREICMYSSMSRIPASEDEYRTSPFYRGIQLLEHGCVRNVLQVGFHLSGEVAPPPSPLPAGYTSLIDIDKTYKVSLSFDRCKITSVTCSCDTKDIFWCQHVVALALYRIRNANKIQLRVPISETLLQMDRQQLQKFVQYLISEHHTEVLPTAQHLADEIMQHKSTINQIDGAPDPTAGADADWENTWHLDEAQVRDQVKGYLSQGGYFNANKQLASMFSKVREMLRVRDSNGSRMLMLITEQFLADPRLILWKSQGTPMTDKCRVLWDQLSSIWVSVVLNPKCDNQDRQIWRAALEAWAKLEICPLEDPDHRYHTSSTSATTSTSSLQASRRPSAEASPMQQDAAAAAAVDEESHPPAADVILEKRPILGPDPDQMTSSDHANNSASLSSTSKRSRKYRRPRTVFHKALDALQVDWKDPALVKILAKDESILWQEHIPTACARIDALKTHGYDVEALRLAVSIARTMKHNQNVAYTHWVQNHSHYKNLDCTTSGVARNPGFASWEGWMGHALNPIGCLFNTLVETCVLPGDKGKLVHHLDLSVGDETTSSSPPAGSSSTVVRYHHVPLEGSRHESYLSLAMEAALVAMGQQRVMPPGLYAQEKSVKQEEKLLTKLQELELDSTLVGVLVHQATIQMDMGPTSGLGHAIHPESIPMQTYAKYLFHALLPYDSELAFKAGLRAMRLPILEELEAEEAAAAVAAAAVAAVPALAAAVAQHDRDPGDGAGYVHPSSFVMSRVPRWFTLGHIESQQCGLASRMLSAAKADLLKLRAVLDSAQRHIHSSSHLFKLAQDAFRYALPQDTTSPSASNSTNLPRHPALLNVAFQLGLQVMRMTLTSLNWRRREMVRWLVTCATEIGLEALISLMQTWKHLFTPTEATGLVATTIMSHSTVMKLNLDFTQQEEMAACARTLALQCSHEDPSSCALNALTLCENEPLAFETAYQIVTDAANHIMTSSQLFTIARYMEHRGYPHRAHKLAVLAMMTVQLAYNQDSHPAINDIHWAAALSHSLGKNELADLVPLVVKNVQCATVLADVLRRCSMTAPGMHDHKRVAAAKGLSSLVAASVTHRPLSYDRSPLRQLLEAAIAAFVTSTHSRLSSISPRHYNEFIDFLTKTRETFLLANDGPTQFAQLLENMKLAYKGKKKLISLIKERFG